MENLQNQDNENQEETLNQDGASENEEGENQDSNQEDEWGENNSWNSEELQSKIDALQAELAIEKKAKNKAKYGAYSKKSKDAKAEQPNVSELVKAEMDKIDYFRENSDVDKADIEKIMSEEGYSLKDAAILSEGRKMQDEAYARTKNAGKSKVSWSFDKATWKTTNPFATWPKAYS